MDLKIKYNQCIDTIEVHEIKFHGYNDVGFVSFSVDGNTNRLIKKDTLPPKGLSVGEVNDFVMKNFNICNNK